MSLIKFTNTIKEAKDNKMIPNNGIFSGTVSGEPEQILTSGTISLKTNIAKVTLNPPRLMAKAAIMMYFRVFFLYVLLCEVFKAI